MKAFSKILLLIVTAAFIPAGCDTDTSFKNPWKNLFDSKGRLLKRRDLHIEKGMEAWRIGNKQLALNELEAALKIDDKHVDALTTVGNIYRRDENYEKAREYYEKACKHGPREFSPHYNAGVTYQALAEYAKTLQKAQDFLREAVVKFRRSVLLSPESYDAHLNLGACYYLLDRPKSALQYFKKAHKLDPEDYKAVTNLGTLYDSLGQNKLAISFYKRTLELNIDQPLVSVSLASVLIRMKKYSRAVSTLGQAIKRAPDNSRLHQELGLCYYQMRQLNKSLRAFQDAIRCDPENTAAYRGAGKVCMYQHLITPKDKLYDYAMEAWKYSLQLDPTQDDLRKAIAKYSKLRNPPAASADSQTAPDRDSSINQ